MALTGIYSEVNMNQEQVLKKAVRKGRETGLPLVGKKILGKLVCDLSQNI